MSELLGWQFSAGFVGGVAVGIGLMFYLARSVAGEVRAGQARRSVAIIDRVVALEMTGPGVKDASARLAARVFIAAIEADARRR